MANAIYPKGKEAFLTSAVSWTADTIKVVLVDTGAYTYSTSHQYLSDIPSGARIATSLALTSKTATDGVADAADVTFTAVTGVSIEALAIYKDTGSEGTSNLILYVDSVASGLPVTPNGGNIVVTWDNGANKIFAL